MHARERIYEAAVRGARPLLGIAAPFHAKLGRGVRGRRGAVAGLEAWAAEARDPSRPLVWVHAPSVGEGLMAQAIVAALRTRRPDAQLAFTFFSPSAERLAARVGADVSGYLPWDVRPDVRRALDALRPDVIAFVRTEIWPVLAREAVGRGARLALVNAVLGAGSSRLRAGSRYLLGPAYARLDAVGAVAAPDAARFARLGVCADRVRVTGDARFDQVWSRVERLREAGVRDRHLLLARLADAAVTTVVAGSTWPADDARLVPAFARARRSAPFRLIAAPHEPDAAHLAALERALDAAGLRHARLAAVEHGGEPLPEVVVVDRVGVLADLYAIADVAYVGGGFGRAGLHSVVEPAALGVPVLFGPRHGNAREADALAWAGGGSVIRGARELEEALTRLAREPARRAEAGRAAAEFVRAGLGGAAANAELIAALLEGAPVPSG
ncbi:MAG TPA: glycosyltransferase N-terminal domain-containing protein [Longimicrobiales bacterium]